MELKTQTLIKLSYKLRWTSMELMNCNQKKKKKTSNLRKIKKMKWKKLYELTFKRIYHENYLN